MDHRGRRRGGCVLHHGFQNGNDVAKAWSMLRLLEASLDDVLQSWVHVISQSELSICPAYCSNNLQCTSSPLSSTALHNMDLCDTKVVPHS